MVLTLWTLRKSDVEPFDPTEIYDEAVNDDGVENIEVDDAEVTENEVENIEVNCAEVTDEVVNDDDPFEGLDEILGHGSNVEEQLYKPEFNAADDSSIEANQNRENLVVNSQQFSNMMNQEIFVDPFVFNYEEDGAEAAADHANDNCEAEDESDGNIENKGDGNSEDEGDGNSEDEGDQEDEDDGHNKLDGEDDSDDPDYVYEENLVRDAEADMYEFRSFVDTSIGDEPPLDEHSEDEETAELDLDDFESEEESDDDTPLKKGIKKLKKKNSTWKADYTTPFYVGQSLDDKQEIYDTIVKTAVDSRRQLTFVKNDKLRMRVVCYGVYPGSVCNLDKVDECSSDKVGECSSGPTNNKASKEVDESEVGESEDNTPPKKKRFPKPTCTWVLHISRKSEDSLWCVKTFKEVHCCLTTRDVHLYTISAIAKEIEPMVESNPTIPIKSLLTHLTRIHQLDLTHNKVYRAKARAMKKLDGDYKAQYQSLRSYSEELIRSNPGTTVKIDIEREINTSSEIRQFRRIYICFAALREGFKVCGRDLLGLDGCFMKGPYPGQILTAVGVDSNNGIYPVAYAIVEAETLCSWTWFLECLGEDLDLQANSNFTFISDRQKGLIPALQKVFPAAEHRFCLRHIHQNMKAKWRGNLLKDLLWKCATATTIPSFERRMETVRKEDADLHKWLTEIPPQHWSRAYFSERPKSDLLLNNLCEVFNKQLVGARDKPIITCLEFIREYMMKRIAGVNKIIARAKGPLTPAATKTFTLIKTLANEYNVIVAGSKKYQVNGPWGDQVAVDLNSKSCSCRRWQLSGMPCKHAAVCIWDYEKNKQQPKLPEQWVSQVYWLETWKAVYQHNLEAINGKSEWMQSACPTTLVAPKHHTQVGRPKKKRKKSAVELAEGISKGGKMVRKGHTVTCGKCKKLGHNSRSCKGQGSSQQASQGAPQPDS